ncbi:hypothetical protein LTR74_016915 [Friedmanniomyces endolithicus]|nr:hypothetical protein LTR74_016915 [Friedmanniomyces endolithicus]
MRNHRAVPRLLWDFHTLEVVGDGKTLTPSIDELKDKFEPINIPVSLACDGGGRGELKLITKSKGFSWESGATGCGYWKGPLLRDVPMAAGVKEGKHTDEGKQRWVNFKGADEPSEGKCETCIPLDYALDPANDVMLPYDINDVPLPPTTATLSACSFQATENDCHHYIWDNRVLPSCITEKDGKFATRMLNHPDTVCNELSLNSVILKPAQGEKFPLTHARRGETFRTEGYKYDGGGHEVQRVEVSLDGGETWLYCIRKFPDCPIRHGNKFWTWLHWYVDVSVMHLLRAEGISPGTGDGGWMQPSEENKIASAKQAVSAPTKQFKRQEIEKYSTEKDRWIVVDGKVYDPTNVLAWHPGAKAAIVVHGGKFNVSDKDVTFKKINLVLGSSGLTPGYALIARALLGKDEDVQVRMLDANKSKADILLHHELNHFEEESHGRLKITHVLSHPSDDWKGLKGYVNADIIKKNLFAPREGTACFMCGPPAMIQIAALPASEGEGSSVWADTVDYLLMLVQIGASRKTNIFGFSQTVTGAVPRNFRAPGYCFPFRDSSSAISTSVFWSFPVAFTGNAIKPSCYNEAAPAKAQSGPKISGTCCLTRASVIPSKTSTTATGSWPSVGDVIAMTTVCNRLSASANFTVPMQLVLTGAFRELRNAAFQRCRRNWYTSTLDNVLAPTEYIDHAILTH